MKSEISRYNIVSTVISEGDASMNAVNKSRLERKLLDSLNKGSYINLFFFKMSKNLMLSVLGVLILAAVLTGVYMAMQSNAPEIAQYDEVEAQPAESDSAGSAMKIAVDEHSSFSAAMDSLTFTPFNVSRVLDAQLAAVQTAKTFDGSRSDYLYLVFVKNGESFFTLSQGKMDEANFMKPEDSQEVSLVVNGENVTGYYIQYDDLEFDPNSEIVLYGTVTVSADSGLAFYLDGIYVEISEFAGLTLDDMKVIAESLSK